MILVQLIAEREGMFHPMTDRRSALAANGPQISSARAGNHRIRFLRLTALERADPLQHEAAGSPRHSTGNMFDAHERRRAVRTVHHQIFRATLALDVARERF